MEYEHSPMAVPLHTVCSHDTVAYFEVFTLLDLSIVQSVKPYYATGHRLNGLWNGRYNGYGVRGN